MRFLKALRNRLRKRRLLASRKVSGIRGPRRLRATRGESPVFRFEAYRGMGVFESLSENWDRITDDVFKTGGRVLVKVNLNSSDPYPASTCPRAMAAFLDLLKFRGFTDLAVGDCSGIRDLPTRKVAKETGLLDAIEGKAEFFAFEEGRWFSVDIPGRYLKEVTLPEAVFESNVIISFANIKSHALADFSLSMKLAVGFMHPAERFALHEDHLQEKCVELSLAVMPDLVVIDGRTAMVTGGPYEGKTADLAVFLVGRDPLCVDLAAYRELETARRSPADPGNFTRDPFGMRQFSHAVEIGLGQAVLPEIVHMGRHTMEEEKMP